MSYISDKDLSEWIAPTGTPGNPLYQLGQQAKLAACQLWRDYPKSFVGNNPVSAPIRHAWNSFCQEPPTNQPPRTPDPPVFTGGQCTFRYNLYVRFNRVNLIGSPPNQQCVDSQDPQAQYALDPYAHRGYFWGPIGGVKLTNFDSTNCGGYISMQVLCFGVGSNARLSTQQWVTVNLLPGGTGSSGRLTSINTVAVKPYTSGTTDNCGNLPNAYPDTPAPANNLNYTFNINGGDSNTNLSFTYKPTFNMPITFKGSDIDITVDFGGINFDWHGSKDRPGGDKNPFPTFPPPSRPPGGRGGGGGGDNPQPDDDDLTKKPPVDIPPEGELTEDETDQDEYVWIIIEVLSIWQNSKFIIEDVNPDDTVYFAGYLAWRTQSASGALNVAPEIPLRRKRTVIRKPPEYTGYKVRSQNGAALRVTSYTQKKVKEEKGA